LSSQYYISTGGLSEEKKKVYTMYVFLTPFRKEIPYNKKVHASRIESHAKWALALYP